MDARACEHEIDGIRFMYKTDRTQMNFAARDYSTFIKGPFIICVINFLLLMIEFFYCTSQF